MNKKKKRLRAITHFSKYVCQKRFMYAIQCDIIVYINIESWVECTFNYFHDKVYYISLFVIVFQCRCNWDLYLFGVGRNETFTHIDTSQKIEVLD